MERHSFLAGRWGHLQTHGFCKVRAYLKFWISWSFCRIVGIYACAFLMIVISLDRFYEQPSCQLERPFFLSRLSAIMFPIAHRSSSPRTKVMLCVAWILAPVCSLSKSFFFHVLSHPLVQSFWQCTQIGSFSSANMVRFLSGSGRHDGTYTSY